MNSLNCRSSSSRPAEDFKFDSFCLSNWWIKGKWTHSTHVLRVCQKLASIHRLMIYLISVGIDCKDIKNRGQLQADGLYWLDPDAGSHSNAFLAYCDMTSYNGGWTMCYSTDEYVKPETEVTYSTQFPYGSDGYRTNCNNIPVSLC